jgi:hypothetical protein
MTPTLSLILCSRNDQYMGNSRWRLETTLNYVAAQVQSLGRTKDVEVLVADWGSEVPLRDVLRLTPAAAEIVSFLLVPPEIARPLQKDSPFPEVLALNAAARRSRGTYIGRIDQDTLVGRRFFEVFFDIYEGRQKVELPLDFAIMFSNVRMIPYRFAVRCPPPFIVRNFIDHFGNYLKLEVSSRKEFYKHSVGIFLLSRTLWAECSGYDESMLYMNAMETNMIERLIAAGRPIVDIGKMVQHSFYHLEHYHPWGPRKSSTHRKVNSRHVQCRPGLRPNGDSWGLVGYPLQLHAYLPCQKNYALTPRDPGSGGGVAQIGSILFLVAAQTAFDWLVVRMADGGRLFRRLQLASWRRIEAAVADKFRSISS